ncbi:MAG: hypothetical protein ABI566_07255 [Pseudolysinimonas sp.]
MSTHSDAETRTAVRSYRTEFTIDEDPIRENGMWLNGRADAIDWTDVVVKGGVAYGAYARNSVVEFRAEQGNLETEDDGPVGDWDDPTAMLTGEWGADQYLSGHAFIRNPSAEIFQEIQLRARWTLRPNHCTGYEFIFRVLDDDASYVEIVRWGGVIGTWESLGRAEGKTVGIKDGDLLEACIVGTTLTATINGRDVLTVTNEVLATGAPGFGFNFGEGDTNVDHGLTDFNADTF